MNDNETVYKCVKKLNKIKRPSMAKKKSQVDKSVRFFNF